MTALVIFLCLSSIWKSTEPPPNEWFNVRGILPFVEVRRKASLNFFEQPRLSSGPFDKRFHGLSFSYLFSFCGIHLEYFLTRNSLLAHLKIYRPLDYLLIIKRSVVPGTGLEPARLAALAPETSASTIPPPGHCECKIMSFFLIVQVFYGFFRIFAPN